MASSTTTAAPNVSQAQIDTFMVPGSIAGVRHAQVTARRI
jgi:hypothetical protein